MTTGLLDDFPPAPDRLVTLANWRYCGRRCIGNSASTDPSRDDGSSFLELTDRKL